VGGGTGHITKLTTFLLFVYNTPVSVILNSKALPLTGGGTTIVVDEPIVVVDEGVVVAIVVLEVEVVVVIDVVVGIDVEVVVDDTAGDACVETVPTITWGIMPSGGFGLCLTQYIVGLETLDGSSEMRYSG
jgi:hypothetical protein